ncbi:hypothetical protein [Laspinema olomoucense]|uniref:Uncharacterized protein n=1 Tax=Laspinema olomoucense D3b TaxID=2953688 RepID=A0ABT2NCL3_9CYAN|nr:hypothetical protein [Laspinema sp. D3b]MCT7980419.1 hypothetical protein [Laspinema sp. D3b]
MNAVILNPHIVKLDSFDPNLLTALAQKVRYLGGTFRTSLLPKKRVATLIFYQLPSVELPEILNEVVNAEANSTRTNISEQSLPSNSSSKSAEAMASASLNPISTTQLTTTPAPSNQAIAYDIAPLTSATQSTTTQAPSNQAIAPEPETLDPIDKAKPSTANPEENTWASLVDLLSQRKTKLKKLAQHHKIPGRSSMTHEQKAEALVGFVLASDL